MILTISCNTLLTWHATSSSLKIESLLVTTNHQKNGIFEFLIFNHSNILIITIYIYPKIEQILILTIIIKPWCNYIVIFVTK